MNNKNERTMMFAAATNTRMKIIYAFGRVIPWLKAEELELPPSMPTSSKA
jgi:hypothetical protein